MKRVKYQNSFFSVERILFPNKLVLDSNCDVIRYMRFSEKKKELKGAIEDVAYTYITDLRYSENQLMLVFSKTTRYDIKRSEKDQINIHYFSSDELKSNKEIMKDFEATYMRFCDYCQNKDLKRVFDRSLIERYIAENCFLLSEAEFENGKVYHAYFYSDDSVCLWYSASDFRNIDVDRNLAARANKRLHYEDMKYFKNKGILNYDWGNISTKNNKNPNGIDTFKASFGGAYAEVYYYTAANTILGHTLLLGKKIINFLRWKR